VKSSACDVLVVGAGTTGLTLALQAHDHDAAVRLIERRDECFRPSRALILHPRSLEVLRSLGVTDALMARGDPAPAALLHLGRREISAAVGRLPITDTPFPHLLFEAQSSVEAVLNEALAARGIEVERGAELIELHADGPNAIARVRRAGSDELVACRHVAGCDGPASTVRRAAGIAWPGGHYAQEVVLADVELETGLSAGEVHVVPASSGLLFLFPLRERATWRLLATRAATATRGPPSQPDGVVGDEELQQLIDDLRTTARITDVAWSASVPLEHRIATRYRAGPLLVVGDAAHVHSPAGAQGMNTGIQDATNLGWKLAFACSRPSPTALTETLLDSYEHERRPIARRVLAITHLLFWAESGTGPVPSFLRRRVVSATAPALPFLLRRRRLTAAAVRRLSLLDARYPNSPISLQGVSPGRRSAGLGRRLGDESVKSAGRTCRLHDLVSSPGVHLLLDHHAPALAEEPLGAHVHVHRIDDWLGRGVLGVRPDGHVGYRSTIVETDELWRWLAMVGVHPADRVRRDVPVGSGTIGSTHRAGEDPDLQP
jgi:2-polyprenyl-6-methoxyphenol hydroxylase-like FAD-dependent oxidoreductase